MALTQVVNADIFNEVWSTLAPHSTPKERASAYQSLANYLKGDVTEDFVSALSDKNKNIIQLILGDIAGRTSALEAIQLLGYCLFTPQFAEACGDEAGNIIRVLCTIPYDKTVEKSVITRALWCLSSQNFHSYQICHSVPQIITLATDVITEHGFGSLAVESLNVFLRINQQCPKEFGLVASVWYKGIIVLLHCKVAKFQRKAHSFAVLFESSIASNSYLVGYLSKELKERVISSLLGYMDERGKDPILILNIWSHFISVLGHALHKHSSFLNEMLRVVETGFKHKVFVVQVTAYNSWKALINNFSINMDLLTQQRRLKLLLMPLLASAVKDKHEQVEMARLQTWWYLITKLGPNRTILFQQVCIPFLLFCLGVDPKLDLSKLPSVLSDLGLSWNQPSHNGIPDDHSKKETQDKENVPSSVTCPTGQVKTQSGQALGSSRAGKLLSLLSSLSQSKKSDRYQSTPCLPLVLSGCHAILLFLGCDDTTLSGSLLNIDGDMSYTVYPHSTIPFNIVQFLLTFLDGALLYMIHYRKEGSSVEYLIKSLIPIFISTLKQEGTSDLKAVAHVVIILTNMMKWETIIRHVNTAIRLDIISQLTSLIPAITNAIYNTYGSMYWYGLAQDLITMAPTEHSNMMFMTCWVNIVELVTIQSHCTLTSFSTLCDLLDQFVELVIQVEAPRKQQLQPIAILSRMWKTLAHVFIAHVKKTSQLNEGTNLDPDFTAARRILKLPFQHRIFYNSEKLAVNSTLETWKEAYDIFSIHCSLVVKDPNHCAELVCKDLYESYGQNVRGDAATLDKTETINFDMYQNTTGLALTRILTKFNWGHLKTTFIRGEEEKSSRVITGGRSSGGSSSIAAKSLQPLISLLSWQLATIWDTVQRSPMQIGHLTSPYTLMETVTLLYSHLPISDLIHTTTEMLAQPMVTLWQNILDKPAQPSYKSLHKGPLDLPERITKTWKSILTCFQSRYTEPFKSDVLSALSPLLVFALSSQMQELVHMTLTFWKATFDVSTEVLVYPSKLRDIFIKLKKRPDLVLNLPGFENSQQISHDNHHLTEPVAMTTVTPSIINTSSSHTMSVIVPHPSPKKGVRGSFLDRPPKPIVSSTPPRSPAAQDMDDILTRSHGGQRSGRVGDMSPALSARRKLSLNSDMVDNYVAVEPPAKRQQLLTEHQREKFRERSDSIPALYNALDPSQDPSQFTTTQSSVPDSGLEEPIIIPESEDLLPPVTTVDTTSIIQSTNTSISNNQHTNPGVSVQCSVIDGVVGPGHVRKSPISSRTRSQHRPSDISSSSNSNSVLGVIPRPMTVTSELPRYPSYPSASPWPYPPHSIVSTSVPVSAPSTGTSLQMIGITNSNGGGTSPVLGPQHYNTLPSYSSAISSSPTEQHYQYSLASTGQAMQHRILHSHTIRPHSNALMLHLPHQPMIGSTQGGHPTLGGSYVPTQPIHSSLGSPTLAPMQQSQTNIATLQKPTPDPTFPPARYIIRPSSSPYPTTICTPLRPHHGEPTIQPLPLSAIVRPDLSLARRTVNRQRSYSLTQQPQSIPAPGTLLTSTVILPGQTPTQPTTTVTTTLLRGNSVDSPIVIEDIEDPLTSMRSQEHEIEQMDTTGTHETSNSSSEAANTPEHVQSEPAIDSGVSGAYKDVHDGNVMEKDIATVKPIANDRLVQTTVSASDYSTTSSSMQVKLTVDSAAQSSIASDSLIETRVTVDSAAQSSIASDSLIETRVTVDSAAQSSIASDSLIETRVTVDSAAQSSIASDSLIETRVTVDSAAQSSIASDSLIETRVTVDSAQPQVEEMEVCTVIEKERDEPSQEQVEEESDQNGDVTIVTESSKPQLAPTSDIAVNIQGVESKSCDDGVKSVCDDEYDSETESCQPGPAPMLTTVASSNEGDPGSYDSNEPISKTADVEDTSDSKVNNNEASNIDNISTTADRVERSEDTSIETVPNSEISANGTVNDIGNDSMRSNEQNENEKNLNIELETSVKGDEISSNIEPATVETISTTSVKHDTDKIPESSTTVVSSADSEKVGTTCAQQQGGKGEELSPAHTLKQILALPVTPTVMTVNETQEKALPSPKTTPGGILKHTSQFDTPTSGIGRCRRVQFASNPVVFQPTKPEQEAGDFKTPKQSRTRTPLSLTSRRKLLKSDQNTRMIQVQKSTSNEPVYPSLTGCESPVEDILPVLSPSRRFTHGLVHLVHARNIHTVGNISSLTEQQIQTLPIKTPKVENLKQALRNFQQQLVQGTKRRAPLDNDNQGPPAKVQKRDKDSAKEEQEHGVECGDDDKEQVLTTTDAVTTTTATPDNIIACNGGPTEDSDSQLSLISQSSQTEQPAVILSSPSLSSDTVVGIEGEGKSLQSNEMIDDDNVFMEDVVVSPFTIESNNDHGMIVTEISSELERTCHRSPTLGSPEIPLQSSPSQIEPSTLNTTTPSQMSVEKGDGSSGGGDGDVGEVSVDSSSDESEEEVMEQGKTETISDNDINRNEIPQQNLKHDHSYFSTNQPSEIDIPPNTASTSSSNNIMTDHIYCSTSEHAVHISQQKLDSESDQVHSELRSKLSSDIQDHNYCRLSPTSSTSEPSCMETTTTTTTTDVIIKVHIESDTSGESSSGGSQELFSASQHEEDSTVTDNTNVAQSIGTHSTVHLARNDVECQTSASETSEKSTSADLLQVPRSIDDSLSSIIDGLQVGDNNLSMSTLLKFQRQLIRGLSIVSDIIEAKPCFENL